MNQVRVYDELSRRLATGASVGAALGRFRRVPGCEVLGNELILFGDPSVQAVPRGTTAGPVTRDGRARFRLPDAVDPDVGFLKLLTGTVGSELSDERRTALREASAAVARFDRSVASGADPERDGVGPAMRTAVLRCLATTRSTRVEDLWVNGFMTVAEGGALCHSCGLQAQSYLGRSRLSGEVPRRLITCPRCGVVRDAPADLDLSLTLGAATLRINGRVPDLPLAAAAFVGSKRRSEKLWEAWPVSAHGRLVRELRIDPTRWPPGPLRVGVVLLAGARLAIIACATRRRTTRAAP